MGSGLRNDEQGWVERGGKARKEAPAMHLPRMAISNAENPSSVSTLGSAPHSSSALTHPAWLAYAA